MTVNVKDLRDALDMPEALLATMLTVNTPAVVGVPENIPPSDNVIPAGRFPDALQVMGAVHVAANSVLYAVLMVAGGMLIVVIDGAITDGASMTRVKLLLLLPDEFSAKTENA